MKVSKGLYSYCAYGLRIDSAIYLPELVSDELLSEPSDITIRLGKVGLHSHANETTRGFWVRGNQTCYYLHKVGAFLVSEGRHILVEPYPGAARKSLRLSILGPALALALHQRGFFLLHASAISIEGAVVAFLGGHGWGKSTMAALLHALGHTVVSDDVTALDLQNHTVVPSFPQLKLWPDAVRALGLSSLRLPQVHPELEKRALRFTKGFAPCPLPLRRLYVLGIGQLTAVEILRPTQALEEIICHWYGARFGPTFFNSLDFREHFLRASGLARAVPVRRLQRPTTLLDDPDLPKAIEREILTDLENPRMSVTRTKGLA